MDLEYFKYKICDELEGAEDYAKKAIELKAMTTQWAKMLYEMANIELSHASNLFKMFEEYYQKVSAPYGEVPKCMKDIRTEILETYTEKTSKVKYILGMYNA